MFTILGLIMRDGGKAEGRALEVDECLEGRGWLGSLGKTEHDQSVPRLRSNASAYFLALLDPALDELGGQNILQLRLLALLNLLVCPVRPRINDTDAGTEQGVLLLLIRALGAISPWWGQQVAHVDDSISRLRPAGVRPGDSARDAGSRGFFTSEVRRCLHAPCAIPCRILVMICGTIQPSKIVSEYETYTKKI
jgi:hypothetical protein